MSKRARSEEFNTGANPVPDLIGAFERVTGVPYQPVRVKPLSDFEQEKADRAIEREKDRREWQAQP